MEKGILGKRVKELRLSNGYSQEFLAEESRLNLRTIQRIEGGITVPRGDTLSRLAFALKISPDELLDRSKQEDRGQLLLLNLSGLSIILNPFLGLIITLSIWVSKRDKVINADENGKQLLNFQISWLLILSFSIIAVIVYAVLFLKIDVTGTINSPIVTLVLILILAIYYSYSLVLIIINTIRIQKNILVKYKPSFKIIR